jgi:hypothetical protein
MPVLTGKGFELERRRVEVTGTLPCVGFEVFWGCGVARG